MKASTLVRVAAAMVTVVAVAAPARVAGQKNSDKPNAKDAGRPKLSLRAQPPVGVAPVRVVLTAELQGGPDDFEEFYCPTIEWEWGDDTSSEVTPDCDPYEAGKSQIKRRFTVEHMFRREGAYKVYVHLKRKDKMLGSASVTLQIQPGASARE